MSADASRLDQSQPKKATNRTSRLTLVVVFLAAAVIVSLVGRGYFFSQRAALLDKREAELASIRDLKQAQIVQWRSSLIADGRAVVHDPTLDDDVDGWLSRTPDPGAPDNLRTWMETIVSARGYAGAWLISADGSRSINTTGATRPSRRELDEALAAATSSDATITDLYLDATTGSPRLDVIAPLMGGRGVARAVLVLRRDPAQYLYPLIQGWPVPSASSETLLLRRDGGSIVYLNDLRFRSAAALRFSVSAANEEILGVQALSGGPRVVQGVDYRGTPVIGAVGPIEGSPWFIVAKVDRSEAYAPIDDALRSTLLAVALVLVVLGLGLMVVWRQNVLALLRQSLESERSAQQLSQQYDYLTRYANDVVLLANEDLRIIQVNDRAEKVYGYTREELLSMSLGQLRDPRDADTPSLDARLAEGGGDVYESRHSTKTGAIVDVEVSARAIRSGERTLYLAIIRDITDRKRVETELAERHARLQALLDNAPYGAHMYELMPDERLVFTGYNARAGRILGIDHEPLLGKTLEEAFPGNVGTETPEAYRRVARDGGTWSTDQIAYDAEGVAGAFEVYAFSFGPDRVSVFFRDVTELKRADHELRRTSAYLESLIDYANAPIIVWDPTLRITRFNHAFERLTRRSADEVLGHPLELLFPEASRDESLSLIGRAMQGESWESVEIPILRADGDVRIALWNSANIYDVEGGDNLTAVIAQGQDITDRKEAEQALKERTDDLLRSNAELEKFAYVASHDLQEPLRMVSSYTQLLQKRYQGRLDTDADEFIAYAVDGATRMRTLINELLAYSRVGSQGTPFVSTDLESVVDSVMQGLETAIAESGATVTREHLPEVWGDKTQLWQVFQNLITNALKFRGADPVVIHIGARREGDEWVLSVTDNGIGIEPTYFDRIFVIFQRLQSRTDYAGTGMGLAICKRIIERHGGRIWVESSPGAGSTFYFTLQARQEEHS